MEKTSRFKGILIIGKTRSGKTALMVCVLGLFTYIPNVWNMDCFGSEDWANLFDDNDVIIEKFSEFIWYKGWFGSQEVIGVTDKYRPKEELYNNRPICWLTNIPFEEQFKDKLTQKYIKENVTIINLGEEDLITPKDTRTIGGFAGWVKYDPKDSYYYQNFVLPKLREEEEATTSGTTEVIDLTNEEPSTPVVEPPTSPVRPFTEEEILDIQNNPITAGFEENEGIEEEILMNMLTEEEEQNLFEDYYEIYHYEDENDERVKEFKLKYPKFLDYVKKYLKEKFKCNNLKNVLKNPDSILNSLEKK